MFIIIKAYWKVCVLFFDTNEILIYTVKNEGFMKTISIPLSIWEELKTTPHYHDLIEELEDRIILEESIEQDKDRISLDKFLANRKNK